MIETSHALFIAFRQREKQYSDLKSNPGPVPPAVVEAANRAMESAEKAWLDARLAERRRTCGSMNRTDLPPKG
jgi:hypothetical protein